MLISITNLYALEKFWLLNVLRKKEMLKYV